MSSSRKSKPGSSRARNKIYQYVIFFLQPSFYVLPALIFFGSCESNEANQTNKPLYIDLKSYFNKQASELNANNFRLKKFVLKDKESEDKIFDHPNWTEELKPFSECDINKPSWKNSYSIDSTGDSQTLCIKYQAKDSTLKIKSINFCLEHDSITFIRIEKRTDNMYYGYTTTLNYFPMKAYSIQNAQKISFSKEAMVEIKALFLP